MDAVYINTGVQCCRKSIGATWGVALWIFLHTFMLYSWFLLIFVWHRYRLFFSKVIYSFLNSFEFSSEDFAFLHRLAGSIPVAPSYLTFRVFGLGTLLRSTRFYGLLWKRMVLLTLALYSEASQPDHESDLNHKKATPWSTRHWLLESQEPTLRASTFYCLAPIQPQCEQRFYLLTIHMCLTLSYTLFVRL